MPSEDSGNQSPKSVISTAASFSGTSQRQSASNLRRLAIQSTVVGSADRALLHERSDFKSDEPRHSTSKVRRNKRLSGREFPSVGVR